MNSTSGLSARYAPWAVSATVVAVVLGLHLLVRLSIDRLPETHPLFELALEASVLAAATAAVLWAAVIRPLRLTAEAERSATLDREDQLRRFAQRQEFEAQLHRALEMAGDEHAAYRTIRRTLLRGVPRLSAELLLADSSEAHLKQAVEAGPEGRGPRCQVGSPRECPAVRRAQTLRFDSSDALDACPYLEGRAEGTISAVCIPVSVAGRSIGVLHATADEALPPADDETGRLETLATHAGSRLGLLRVMQQTSLQAATDPLTGLLNRRSFENEAHGLIRSGTGFALAMGDLDHFKLLNDTHGHDAGDRALRLFARMMRDALRAEDLVCRFGGEEFVVAFPGNNADEAAAALVRLQQRLAATLATAPVPSFTVSFGVADSYDSSDLEELLRIADAALFRAKREGRNRVVLDMVDRPGAAPTRLVVDKPSA